MITSLPIFTNENQSFNIIGIDPGTENVGIGVINIDSYSKAINNTIGFTIVASKIKDLDMGSEIFKDRFNRINKIKNELLNIFYSYNPLFAVLESPYFNPKRPAAFAALVEATNAIEQACFEYNRQLVLYKIDPSSVKNAVGAKGGADKNNIKDCLIGLNVLNIANNIFSLDEHSIDAIAVAYCQYKRLLENNYV